MCHALERSHWECSWEGPRDNGTQPGYLPFFNHINFILRVSGRKAMKCFKHIQSVYFSPFYFHLVCSSDAEPLQTGNEKKKPPLQQPPPTTNQTMKIIPQRKMMSYFWSAHTWTTTALNIPLLSSPGPKEPASSPSRNSQIRKSTSSLKMTPTMNTIQKNGADSTGPSRTIQPGIAKHPMIQSHKKKPWP